MNHNPWVRPDACATRLATRHRSWREETDAVVTNFLPPFLLRVRHPRSAQ